MRPSHSTGFRLSIFSAQISNRRGFGIMEVMVAAGLMGILSLAFMTMTNMNMKGQKSVEKNAAVNTTIEQIRSTLGVKTACLNTVADAKASGGSGDPSGAGFAVKNIVDKGGAVQYSVGGRYENSNLAITSMILGGYQASNSTSTLTVKIDVKDNSGNANSLGPQSFIRLIQVQTILDASNQITSCVSLARMEDGLWNQVKGTSTDIQYNAGNVGVGTGGSAPAGTLHVHKPAAPGQGIITISGVADAGGTYSALYLADNDPWTGSGGMNGLNRNSWGFAHKTGDDSLETVNWANNQGYIFSKFVPDMNAVTASKRLPTSTKGTVFSITPEDSVGTYGYHTTFQSTLEINSPVLQGALFLRGAGDPAGSPGQPSWSVLYLGRSDKDLQDDSWALAMKKPYGASNGAFHIFRYFNGNKNAPLPFAITDFIGSDGVSHFVRTGINTDNPLAELHVLGDIKTSGNMVSGALGSIYASGNLTTVGNVTSGSTMYAKYDLQVTTNITAGGTITAASDRRLKDNIHPIEDALDRVLKVEGVTYDMKSEAGRKDRRRHIGVVAQNLEAVFPELVETSSSGMKSVAYGNISAVLIEAVREQKRRSDEEIQKLRTENGDLKARLDAVERKLSGH